MKKFLQTNAFNLSVFTFVFYIVSMFLTLDPYSKTEVTPETPLLNVAGLPFLRMEFVLIIFSLAFLIGTLIALIFKKAGRILLPFALGVTGLSALFFFLFDVNMMQLLDPTMRISHVIMTVSRVIAIVAGVSGLFAGIAAVFISKYKIASRACVPIAVISSILLSVFANVQSLQTLLYFICGIMLLCSSVILDFFPQKTKTELPVCSCKPSLTSGAAFLTAFTLTVLYATLYSVLWENAGISTTGFTIASGLILLLFAVLLSKKCCCIIASIGMFLGAVVGYVLVHFASEVITYSGNRVIYVLPYGIWFICLFVSVLSIILWLFARKKEAIPNH